MSLLELLIAAKNLSVNVFGFKKLRDTDYQKITIEKNLQENFPSKNIFVRKHFWPKNVFDPKKNLAKQFGVQKRY